MAMQLMAGAQIIDVNQGMKEDRALFGGAQKVIGTRRGGGGSGAVASNLTRRTRTQRTIGDANRASLELRCTRQSAPPCVHMSSHEGGLVDIHTHPSHGIFVKS